MLSLNYWGWQISVIGVVFGLVYISCTSYLLGGRFGRNNQGLAERLVWGATALTALMAITGCVALYSWRLTPELIFGFAAILPWLGNGISNTQKTDDSNHNWTIAIGLTYLALAILTVALIADARTIESIRTPWQVVPPYIFVCYGLTAASFIVLARYAKSPAWAIPLFLVSLSVLPLVYPLGYGFDPFIHQASEVLINTTGTITPKPFYYLGQYALVVQLAKMTSVPINLIDIWLLPILSSLIIPIAAGALVGQYKFNRPWLLITPLIAIAGFAAGSTYTTPQGLANLWAMGAILLMAVRIISPQIPQKLIWMFVIASLATHPLTGLPLLGVTLLWWTTFEHVTIFGKWQKHARWLIAMVTALIIPVAFIILSRLAPGAASVQLANNPLMKIEQLGANIRLSLPVLPMFSDIGDAIELISRPLTLILLLLVGLGWINAKKEFAGLKFFAFAAALPTVSFLILTIGFTFPGLPDNEQNFYNARLWALALTFSLPLMLLGAQNLGYRILKKMPNFVPMAIGGSLLLTSCFYLAYPRFDRWHRDTAYNTAPADMAAVKLIEQTAAGLPYVVLANQAVAAAAIKEFGFAHYYQNYFYYPIPTGVNPLYGIYLEATEYGTPKREVIATAIQHLGVPQVYLVLNRYWANFLKLAPIAQNEADNYWQLDNDRVQVYRYNF